MPRRVVDDRLAESPSKPIQPIQPKRKENEVPVPQHFILPAVLLAAGLAATGAAFGQDLKFRPPSPAPASPLDSEPAVRPLPGIESLPAPLENEPDAGTPGAATPEDPSAAPAPGGVEQITIRIPPKLAGLFEPDVADLPGGSSSRQNLPGLRMPLVPSAEALADLEEARLLELLGFTSDVLARELEQVPGGNPWNTFLKLDELGAALRGEEAVDAALIQATMRQFDRASIAPQYDAVTGLWGFRATRIVLAELAAPVLERDRRRLEAAVARLIRALQTRNKGARWREYLQLDRLQEIVAVQPQDLDRGRREALGEIANRFDKIAEEEAYRAMSELPQFVRTAEVLAAYQADILRSLPEAPSPGDLLDPSDPPSSDSPSPGMREPDPDNPPLRPRSPLDDSIPLPAPALPTDPALGPDFSVEPEAPTETEPGMSPPGALPLPRPSGDAPAPPPGTPRLELQTPLPSNRPAAPTESTPPNFRRRTSLRPEVSMTPDVPRALAEVSAATSPWGYRRERFVSSGVEVDRVIRVLDGGDQKLISPEQWRQIEPQCERLRTALPTATAWWMTAPAFVAQIAERLEGGVEFLGAADGDNRHPHAEGRRFWSSEPTCEIAGKRAPDPVDATAWFLLELENADRAAEFARIWTVAAERCAALPSGVGTADRWTLIRDAWIESEADLKAQGLVRTVRLLEGHTADLGLDEKLEQGFGRRYRQYRRWVAQAAQEDGTVRLSALRETLLAGAGKYAAASDASGMTYRQRLEAIFAERFPQPSE